MFFFFTADLRVHEFFKTPYFKTGIHPLPGAKETLHKLSGFCNLSVVTYVQLAEFLSNFLCLHEHGLTCFGMYAKLKGLVRMQSRTIQFNGLKVIFQDYFRRFTLGTTLLYMESQGLSQKYAGMLQILQFKVDVVFKYPFPQTKIVWCMFACLLVLWSTLQYHYRLCSDDMDLQVSRSNGSD